MKRSLPRPLPLLLLTVMFSPSLYGQPVPTVTFKPNSSTLQLPGSLSINAFVAPPAETPGVPTGSVQFFYNGTSSLGTVPLSVESSTENFNAPAVTTTAGVEPIGLFALSSPTPKYSILGLLDNGSNGPDITIFSGQGANLFQSSTTATYQIPNQANFEGIMSGTMVDFNHDGIPDVFLHAYLSTAINGVSGWVYFVLLGNADGTYGVTTKYPSPTEVVSQDLGIVGDSPVETTVVADFNGDGYPDVAYVNTAGDVGIALNGGKSSPAAFSFSSPTQLLPSGFTTAAIASGQFTTSGNADVIVAGSIVSTTTTGELALLTGNGDGTLGAPTTVTVTNIPSAVATADFRNNGLTDVVVVAQNTAAPAPAGDVQVLFGDGKGTLTSSSTVTLSFLPASVNVADFNGDGYPDILVTGTDGSLNLLLNDGKGDFSTVSSVGTSTAASFTTVGDFNGDGLSDIAEITQSPVGSATAPSALALLNSASSQATFTTAPQTLPAGIQAVTAAYPGDANLAAATSAAQQITVTQTPSTLNWPAPASIDYGAALGATQLDATSSVPGAIVYTPGAGTVLSVGQHTLNAVFTPTDSFDYTGATASQSITVVSAPVTAQASLAANVVAGQDSSVTLTVSPYPLPLTAILTLSFTPAPPNTLNDPTVVFSNNSDSQTINIAANSSAAIPPIDFSPGSTAGTITLTVQLTETASGVNLTPASLVPIVITIPPSPPGIGSFTLSRNGNSLTAAITGLSPTRDMTEATFHFTAAPGQTLKTTDLTVQLSTAFTNWYQSSDSDQFGTTFLYTQPFTLSTDATSVSSVTVTLTNSQGASQPVTAQ